MKKRISKCRRKQGLSADEFKDFQEPKTIDEILGIFASHGEEVAVERIENIFKKSGMERMSILEVTAWLLDSKKGGAA